MVPFIYRHVSGAGEGEPLQTTADFSPKAAEHIVNPQTPDDLNQDEFQDKILALLFTLVELRLEGPLLALLLALVLLPLLLPEPALRILMKELLHWDSPFLPQRGQPCKDITF